MNKSRRGPTVTQPISNHQPVDFNQPRFEIEPRASAATDGRASVDSAATPAPGGGSSLPVGWTTTMWCVAQPAAQATRVSQCCLFAGAGRCTTGTASQVRRAPRRRSWTPPHRLAAPTGGSEPGAALPPTLARRFKISIHSCYFLGISAKDADKFCNSLGFRAMPIR